jgi:hypothetical protein
MHVQVAVGAAMWHCNSTAATNDSSIIVSKANGQGQQYHVPMLLWP